MVKRSGLEMIGGNQPEETQLPPAAPAGVRDGWVRPDTTGAGESLVHGIPMASMRGRRGSGRKDQRQREPVVSFRGIPPELKARVEKLADEQSVPVGMLARYLFEHGIAAYASQQLALEPALTTGAWSLYPSAPGDGARRTNRAGRKPGKKTKSAQAKNEQSPVAYRGVPPETRQNLTNIASELGVPVGEVARRMLEYGLDEYGAGRLKMERYPVSTAARTLYPNPPQTPPAPRTSPPPDLPATREELRTLSGAASGENRTNTNLDEIM